MGGGGAAAPPARPRRRALARKASARGSTSGGLPAPCPSLPDALLPSVIGEPFRKSQSARTQSGAASGGGVGGSNQCTRARWGRHGGEQQQRQRASKGGQQQQQQGRGVGAGSSCRQLIFQLIILEKKVCLEAVAPPAACGRVHEKGGGSGGSARVALPACARRGTARRQAGRQAWRPRVQGTKPLQTHLLRRAAWHQSRHSSPSPNRPRAGPPPWAPPVAGTRRPAA